MCDAADVLAGALGRHFNEALAIGAMRYGIYEGLRDRLRLVQDLSRLHCSAIQLLGGDRVGHVFGLSE